MPLALRSRLTAHRKLQAASCKLQAASGKRQAASGKQAVLAGGPCRWRGRGRLCRPIQDAGFRVQGRDSERDGKACVLARSSLPKRKVAEHQSVSLPRPTPRCILHPESRLMARLFRPHGVLAACSLKLAADFSERRSEKFDATIRSCHISGPIQDQNKHRGEPPDVAPFRPGPGPV